MNIFLISNVLGDDQLSARIIGSGSPMFNVNRAGPSVLISANDTHILVDMGNGTQANLNKLGLKIRELSALFFTHHHILAVMIHV